MTTTAKKAAPKTAPKASASKAERTCYFRDIHGVRCLNPRIRPAAAACIEHDATWRTAHGLKVS